MTIHTSQGKSQDRKVKHNGFTEYLGIKNDLQGQSFTSQYQDTCQQLHKFIQVLITSTAYPQTKYGVLISSAYPAVQYQTRITTLGFRPTNILIIFFTIYCSRLLRILWFPISSTLYAPKICWQRNSPTI